MTEVFTNFGSAVVTAGGTTAPAAGTVQTWTVTATACPVAASGTQFRVVDVADASARPEVMLVTASSNGTGVSWTVTRGAEGSTPVAHTAGFTVKPVVSQAVLDGLTQKPTAVVEQFVTTTGSDSNDGLSWQSAKLTVAAGMAALVAANNYGVLRIGYGTFPITTTLVKPQAIRIEGRSPQVSQGTTLQWTGADDGSYVIRTASDTSGADETWGQVRDILLTYAATKPGGGAYTNINGFNWRNPQNGSLVENVYVRNFPGIGFNLQGANAGVPLNAFPGFCTARRVWSTGNSVNFQTTAGFTSVLFDMCAGDISTQTTDVFIINAPASGTRGKDGNLIFTGFKVEDNGTPSAPGATANCFTVNTDVAISMDGCSWHKDSPGVQPFINYAATPSSPNGPANAIPVTLINCTTTNVAVQVQGPTGAALLSAGAASAGEAMQIPLWVGFASATTWQGTHSGLAADGLQINGTTAANVPLSIVPAFGQTAHLSDWSGFKVSDSFDRADSASTLGSADVGGAWTAWAGTWGISSNKGYLVTTTDDARAYLDGLVPDGTLTVDITQSATRCFAGVSLRGVDANNELLVRYKSTTNDLLLSKRVSSVVSTLTNVNPAWPAGTTKTLKVVCKGTLIQVYLGGVLEISYTLTGGDASTFTTPTLIGMYVNARAVDGDDGGSRYNNFAWSTVAAYIDSAGKLGITPATTTSAPSAGGAGALPATPLGYLTINVNGTDRKVAYY